MQLVVVSSLSFSLVELRNYRDFSGFLFIFFELFFLFGEGARGYLPNLLSSPAPFFVIFYYPLVTFFCAPLTCLLSAHWQPPFFLFLAP
jgi:hypothetical protein